VIFGIMIVAAWFFCGVLPTSIMPSWGMAMALPVIQVPGEVYKAAWPSAGFEFTNTLAGMLLADLVVLLIALAAFQASRGWTKEVPGGFQGMIEVLVGGLYGLVKNMAGTAKVVRTQLFPLVATIFFFLLIANWLELIPGVDSIGIKHCAHPGMNSYAASNDGRWLGFDVLHNEQLLFVGYPVESEEQYHACEELLEGHLTVEAVYNDETEHEIDEIVAALNAEESELTADEIHELEEEYAHFTGYEHPLIFLDSATLESGIAPYGYVITPFIRAAATDMNLTFALAIISIIAIQYFGMSALGMGYWQKFVNLKALGNAGKRPMGLMDFGVGLFEIVSEIAKMISLSFRLFGNIFAGQLLIFIITFLVATLLPVAVYGLEFAVAFIQALVFGMLTLVFSAQAMVSHDHDAHDEGHH
jgi:F-type H+-transporting ATPase subunit a